jgi:hypothetical protein
MGRHPIKFITGDPVLNVYIIQLVLAIRDHGKF